MPDVDAAAEQAYRVWAEGCGYDADLAWSGKLAFLAAWAEATERERALADALAEKLRELRQQFLPASESYVAWRQRLGASVDDALAAHDAARRGEDNGSVHT